MGESNRAAVRRQFARHAEENAGSFKALCDAFGISRTTGYRWLARYRKAGPLGLSDESRRPKTSPKRTRKEINDAISDLKKQQPRWGARRIRKWLSENTNFEVPSETTINRILRRPPTRR